MKRVTLLAAGVLFALSGCQSTAEKAHKEQITNQVSKEVNDFDRYEQAKSNYETWLVTLNESKGLKLYSSRLYAGLLSSWNQAVEIYEEIAVDPAKVNERYSLFSSTTYSEAFTEELSEVAEKYAAIIKIKTQADLILADALSQMHYLEKMGAATVFADEYHDIYDDYSELFEYIVDNKIASAQTEQVDFMNKAKALEEKMLLAKYIAPLQKALNNFADQGFRKVAAISYAKAEAEINAASSIVKANTRDLQVIEQAVADAQFELAHLRNVAHEVKSLSSVKSSQFEPAVLEYERKLLSVSKALNGADYRDQPLRVQADLIVAGVNKLHENNNTEKLEAKLASLNSEIERLKLFNVSQATLLGESKNKIESLDKQLQRSEFQIVSQQTLLNSYNQQLESKRSEAKIEHAIVESKEEAAVKYEEPAVVEPKELAVVELEEPSVVESKEQVAVELEKPAVVESKEQVAVKPAEPVVVEPQEQVAVKAEELAVVEPQEQVALKPEEEVIVTPENLAAEDSKV
jgi:hypothetical protein